MSVADLECHFNWKLEAESNKNASELVDYVEETLKEEPLNGVPYLCLLSYLFTTREIVCYDRAYSYLDKAENLNNDIAYGILSSDHIGCRFVVEANRLNIDAIRSAKTPDHEERVRKLYDMWNDADDEATRNAVRASVYLVKSVSCMRFGPSKYGLGAAAAEQAESLSRDTRSRGNLFHAVFLRANLTARMRRQRSRNLPANNEECSLWSEALNLCQESYKHNREETMCTQLSAVKVLYAVAIINDEKQTRTAETLTDEAVGLLLDALKGSVESIERNYKTILKSCKVYRILHKENKLQNMLELLKPLKDRTTNPQLLFELAMQAKEEKNVDEQEHLLLKAQRVARHPGHLWVETQLLRLQHRLSYHKKRMKLDELIRKFEGDSSSIAVLNFEIGFLCAENDKVKDVMNFLVQAVSLAPDVKQKLHAKDRIWLLRKISDYTSVQKSQPSFEAWYMENMIDNPDPVKVQSLFEDALSSNPTSQFALQHYGINRIRVGDFQKAEILFRKLNDTCDAKQKLLSESLLKQISISQDSTWIISRISECLMIGCKDACCTAIDQLNKMKLSDTELLKQVTESHSSLTLKESSSSHLSTQSYNLCAQVHRVLDSHTAFFINKELDTPEFSDKVRDSIELFLQTKTSASHPNQPAQRGNPMRENRFKASKLFISDQQFATPELNDAIVAALKEAKESLDRSFSEFQSRNGITMSQPVYYPHGFTFAIKEIEKDKDYNVKKSKLNTDDEKKAHEMTAVIKFLSALSRKSLLSNIRDKLPSVLNEVTVGDRVDTLRNVLANRESAIICSQGPWLVLWGSFVNIEKHTMRMDVQQLNCQLKSLCRNQSLQDAFNMMHKAVEFAEETEVLMLAAARTHVQHSALTD